MVLKKRLILFSKLIHQLNSTKQKVFSHIKGKQTVGISETYWGSPETVDVLKRKFTISLMCENFEVLPQTNHVKIAKQNDVRRLLHFYYSRRCQAI